MFIARYLVGVRKSRKLGRDGRRPSEKAMLMMMMMRSMMRVTLSDRRGARRKVKGKKREGRRPRKHRTTLQPEPISTPAQLSLLLYLLNPPRPPLEPPHPSPLLQQHHRDPSHEERARRTKLLSPSSNVQERRTPRWTLGFLFLLLLLLPFALPPLTTNSYTLPTHTHTSFQLLYPNQTSLKRPRCPP
jgi:hypothetical protein